LPNLAAIIVETNQLPRSKDAQDAQNKKTPPPERESGVLFDHDM
jgi:hypothetical protein